jgi:hypothetical protein
VVGAVVGAVVTAAVVGAVVTAAVVGAVVAADPEHADAARAVTDNRTAILRVLDMIPSSSVFGLCIT